MAGNAQYLNRITSEHYGKPKFTAWLTALLDMLDPAFAISEAMPDVFYVKEAEGVQLDVIGEIVGISRKIQGDFETLEGSELDDEAYRRLILTKVVSSQWNGLNGSVADLWKEALDGDLNVLYHDNQDMSVTVTLVGEYRPVDVELALRGYIVPKPMGVSMTTQLNTEARINVELLTVSGFIGTVSKVRFEAED